MFIDPEGFSFANFARRGSRDITKVKCYACQKMGHHTSECLDNEEVALLALMIDGESEEYSEYDEFTFHQSQKCVNPKWILLDNQSTTDIFCNPALLTDFRDAGKSINIHCNAGTHKV